MIPPPSRDRSDIAGHVWCGYIFLLPLNGWINELLGQSLPAVANVGFVLTLITALVLGRLLAWLPPLPFWLFLGYAVILGMTLFFIDANILAAGFRRFGTMGAMVITFWMSGHFCTSPWVRRRTLWALALGGVLLALLTLSGIAQDQMAYKEIRRVFAAGYQANEYAFCLSLALVSLLTLNLTAPEPVPARHALSAVAAVPLFYGLAQSGSRGMLAAFGLAAGVLAITSGTRRAKVIGALVLVTLGGAVLFLWKTDASFVSRWSGAIEDQDLAGRQFILPAVVKLFFEKPIFGWGVVGNFVETAARVRPDLDLYDTHNSFLCVLTEVGLIGFLFFAGGMALCIWKGLLPGSPGARSGALGLFMFFLVSSMTNDQLPNYLSWVVLGLCLTSCEWFDPEPFGEPWRPGALSPFATLEHAGYAAPNQAAIGSGGPGAGNIG